MITFGGVVGFGAAQHRLGSPVSFYNPSSPRKFRSAWRGRRAEGFQNPAAWVTIRLRVNRSHGRIRTAWTIAPGTDRYLMAMPARDVPAGDAQKYHPSARLAIAWMKYDSRSGRESKENAVEKGANANPFPGCLTQRFFLQSPRRTKMSLADVHAGAGP